MILKRKLFSFLSWLAGGGTRKIIKKSANQVREELKKQTQVNKDAIREIKTILPSNLNIPHELQLYLSFIYENYYDTTVTLLDKNGKDKKAMLDWKGIMEKTKRYRKTFNINKNNALIFLVFEKNDKNPFNTMDEYYFCYFPKADGVWLFNIQWGNASQGLFGLCARDNRLLSSLDLMLM